jgi:hypothetical protein
MDKKKTELHKLTVRQKLQRIQSSLKAPKGQINKFGGYSYRSAEDILSAVKPLLSEYECILVNQDTMVEIGGRVYVQTTSTLIDTDGTLGDSVYTTGYAREAEVKKGMDDAQITGSAASYSLKRSLGNLFCISDSSLDPDATNTHGKTNKVTQRAIPSDDII